MPLLRGDGWVDFCYFLDGGWGKGAASAVFEPVGGRVGGWGGVGERVRSGIQSIGIHFIFLEG